MKEESQRGLYYMTNFSFSGTILFMSVCACQSVVNAMVTKVAREREIRHRDQFEVHGAFGQIDAQETHEEQEREN